MFYGLKRARPGFILAAVCFFPSVLFANSAWQGKKFTPASSLYARISPPRQSYQEAAFPSGIPLNETKPLVRYYVRIYGSPINRKSMLHIMESALPYRRFITRELKKNGLPYELLYLPLIESRYRNEVRSRAGAVGMWQFMPGTARVYGISINGWEDERKDFWKSTQAAVKKLKQDYEIFGDWLLALAAYNAGPGRVRKAIRQGGTRDFWTLAERKLLPSETIHYIPKFLAVVKVMSEKNRYDLPVLWKPSPEWVQIPVHKPVSLALLARKAKMPYHLIRGGNAGLRYGVTPPSGAYDLKVTKEKIPSVRRILDGLKPTELLKFHRYRIHYGDTLSEIARYYEIPVSLIRNYNVRLRSSLRVGQSLLIPLIKEKPLYRQKRKETFLTFFGGEYIIQENDTLWGIAKKYNTRPDILARQNHLSMSAVLTPGRKIKVPAVY